LAREPDLDRFVGCLEMQADKLPVYTGSIALKEWVVWHFLVSVVRDGSEGRRCVWIEIEEIKLTQI